MPTVRGQRNDFAPRVQNRCRCCLRTLGIVGRNFRLSLTAFRIPPPQFFGKPKTIDDAPDNQIQMPLAKPHENARQRRPLRPIPEREQQNPEHQKQDRLGTITRNLIRQPTLGIGSGYARVVTCVVGHGRYVNQTTGTCQEQKCRAFLRWSGTIRVCLRNMV